MTEGGASQDRLDRHSRAFEPELVADLDERAAREARNGLRQFDRVIELVEYFLDQDRPFKLRSSQLLTLHREALDGLSNYAGNFRPAAISIGGSKHQPVGAHQVPEAVEELCDYINENWRTKSAIHLASYCLWRLNWIHPFTDGNGRTSRALSFMVLCIRLGYRVPGTNTIPAQISADKTPYYKALEAADLAWRDKKVDLSVLENYLSHLLAQQLASVVDDATRTRE